MSPRTPPERAVSPLPRRAVTGVAEAIAPEVERVLDDRRDDMVDTSKRVELLEEKQYGGGRLEVIYLRPARGASNGYIR